MSGVQTERYRVKEGEKVSLRAWSPADTFGLEEPEALEESKRLLPRFERLQEVLYAEHKRKVLIVLQAMDTGGKDGTIKKVFEGSTLRESGSPTFGRPPRRRQNMTSSGGCTRRRQERRDGHLQQEPLRGRAHRKGPRPRPVEDVVAPLQRDLAPRAPASRGPCRHPEVLPPH
jgi:hypothetical protein